VKTIAVRVGAGGFFATALLVALVLAFPGQRSTLAGAYELVIGALAVAAIVAGMRALEPARWERSAFDRPPEKPPRPEPIAELQRTDRALVLGAANAFDLHHRLRPLLRDLAAERLYAHHGVELDRDQERARELLGDELWDVVRPGRTLRERSGPGLSTGEAARLVRALETV
jgi:hypothetical protein